MDIITENIDNLDPRNFIVVKKARVHNLKDLSVAIPRNKLIVITGVSGSGKTSLAFDTLFAEGQRMYVESLSSYARQFLSRMEKPEVDYIKGLSPAIAIQQKVNTTNTRSTVGTSTEIYDYLKLLFARIGKTYSPVSGKEVQIDTVNSVSEFICGLKKKTKIVILCPFILKEDRTLKKELEILLQKGFTRIYHDNEIKFIEDCLEIEDTGIYIVIDRLIVDEVDENFQFRVNDSIQTAFLEGDGECIVLENDKRHIFNNRFEQDEIKFERPTVNFFTFNNPYGACKTCEGFGSVLGIDEDLVFPDKNLSVCDGAIAPWRTEKMSNWLKPLLKNGIRFDFPIHRSLSELSKEEYNLIWTGNEYFQGLNDFFKEVESQSYKIQYRVMLSRYRGKTTCPDCRGTRLRKDASYVKIKDRSIQDLVLMSIWDLRDFFDKVKISKYEEKVAGRILVEVQNRLEYLERVGLGYLTLNRLSSTLSGGESQRINLATSLGSSLVGSMYVLDEPSIGLHPSDSEKLISVLQHLKNLKNTVLVVEHDEDTMKAADQIIDIGPKAGYFGGKLNFQGNFDSILKSETLTGQYLSHKLYIPVPANIRKPINWIEIKGARHNNLKNIDVKIPIEALTVVTGVSGSGKSTLVRQILYPALAKQLGQGIGEKTGKFGGLEGSLDLIDLVEFIDQNPIGKSSRSNPVTYTKAWDEIRNLFVKQPLSKAHGYKNSHFSFNVDGGRCEMCKGEGKVKVEMQFMADIELTCEACHGKRFKDNILEIKYKDKNIADILELSISEGIEFFEGQKKVLEKLQPLEDVGLGYIKLGQPVSTLSGGEAQRVKLASYLNKKNSAEKIIFIFDEPSTGLHFHDVEKLMTSINALINLGHTVIIIEHNMDIAKCADWIIDLGPVGGDKGGQLVFQGLVNDLINDDDSISVTRKYLAHKLNIDK